MIEKCPICEEHQLLNTFTLPTYKIYTCKACLARFAHPFVNNEEIYNNNLIKAKKQYLDTMAMSDKAYDQLRPFFHVKGKKILDIGCGTGNFLGIIKEHNEVLGLEISEAYRACLEQKEIPYIIGDLEENLRSIPDSYFDLITLWDVFEHFDNPRKLLGLIKEKISSTGVLIIWTNNYGDCISKFAETVYRISFGRLSGLLQTSFNRAGGHNYNFVAKSLEQLYQKNNLKIIKSVITDTPSEKLTINLMFKIILELFYLANQLLGKGKIICHVLKKDEV